MPVRIGIKDVAANELRRSVAECDVVRADRYHKFLVPDPGGRDVAECEFLLYANLASVLCEDDDLLYRLIPDLVLDLVPEIVTAEKPHLVDPDPISSYGQL